MAEVWVRNTDDNYEIWEDFPPKGYSDNTPLTVFDRYTWMLFSNNEQIKNKEIVLVKIEIES